MKTDLAPQCTAPHPQRFSVPWLPALYLQPPCHTSFLLQAFHSQLVFGFQGLLRIPMHLLISLTKGLHSRLCYISRSPANRIGCHCSGWDRDFCYQGLETAYGADLNILTLPPKALVLLPGHISTLSIPTPDSEQQPTASHLLLPSGSFNVMLII